MANLQAATATDGAQVTDPEAVVELCKQYIFDGLDWEITKESEFQIHGYNDLMIYKAERDDDGERLIDYEAGQRTEEFLRKLSRYIVEGDELDIQTAGFTKCRYPMQAKRYVVRHGEILHADLSNAEPLPDDRQPMPDADPMES